MYRSYHRFLLIRIVLYFSVSPARIEDFAVLSEIPGSHRDSQPYARVLLSLRLTNPVYARLGIPVSLPHPLGPLQLQPPDAMGYCSSARHAASEHCMAEHASCGERTASAGLTCYRGGLLDDPPTRCPSRAARVDPDPPPAAARPPRWGPPRGGGAARRGAARLRGGMDVGALFGMLRDALLHRDRPAAAAASASDSAGPSVPGPGRSPQLLPDPGPARAGVRQVHRPPRA